MAANLVSLIMQFITPSMMSKMASTLGLDRDDVQKAIGVSVPAILAGFANVATKPDGGQQLSNAHGAAIRISRSTEKHDRSGGRKSVRRKRHGHVVVASRRRRDECALRRRRPICRDRCECEQVAAWHARPDCGRRGRATATQRRAGRKGPHKSAGVAKRHDRGGDAVGLCQSAGRHGSARRSWRHAGCAAPRRRQSAAESRFRHVELRNRQCRQARRRRTRICGHGRSASRHSPLLGLVLSRP